MKDMTCLVTGASSGLGFEMARGLASTGANVVMLCRDAKWGRKARIELIAKTGNPDIDLIPCDLSNMADVRRFVQEFKSFYPRLDVLANLAGAVYPMHKLTPEGNELNFSTNVLGPFLLTTLLLERLVASGSAAVINVSGEAHRTGQIRFDDLQMMHRYLMSDAIGQVAMARVVWTYELARRLRGTDVTANTFCPGWTRTNLQRHYPAIFRWAAQFAARLFAHSPEEAMHPIIEFTLQKALHGANGFYLSEGKVTDSVPVTYRKTLGRRLWLTLEQLTDTVGQTQWMVGSWQSAVGSRQ